MLPINKTYIVSKDTTDFNGNKIIKKGTIVKATFSGMMPNGEVRITTDKGEIIKLTDLQEESTTIQPMSVTDPEGWKQTLQKSAQADKKMKQIKYAVIVLALVAGYFAYKKFKK